MERGGEQGATRYRAFISYNHRDALIGRRLHRRLERYTLPGRLIGRLTGRGTVPRRIAPIFRDREELAAAHDLTAEVRAALAASAALIVVCSPNAAASPWVAREVELFRALHPDRPILAALFDGEPDEAFPPPLREAGDPLAADFRRGGDGERLAFLKLVAGVVGVGLDEIVQRDAQRRYRAVMAVTAAALTAVLAMGLLTAFALRASAEAGRQQEQSESLVDFMQTDLRETLRGEERLAVLAKVSRRALQYYEQQDVEGLPPSSRRRYARVLHAIGEDDESRGHLDRAITRFKAADRVTGALLAADPDNPDNILNQAQSEYWLGYADYRRDRFESARARFTRYRDLAQALTRRAPGNAGYLRELAYAEGSLCTAVLSPPVDSGAALRHCASALAAMETAARGLKDDPRIGSDLINRHAWMADAYDAAGDPRRALDERLEQERQLEALIATQPSDAGRKADWVALQRALASLLVKSGDEAAALERLRKARVAAEKLSEFDPEDARVVRMLDGINKSVAYLETPPAQRRRK